MRSGRTWESDERSACGRPASGGLLMRPAEFRRVRPALLVECRSAGPCALWHGQPGQVGNEAATAISRKCRRQGSPLLIRCSFVSDCRDRISYMDMRFSSCDRHLPEFFSFAADFCAACCSPSSPCVLSFAARRFLAVDHDPVDGAGFSAASILSASCNEQANTS